MSRATVENLLQTPGDGRQVRACGWIRTRRNSKNVVFLELNDGSSLASLQVVINKNDGDATAGGLLTGASVAVEGRLTASQGKGQGIELLADDVEIIGEAPPDYPLQKKRHSFEFLREIAHLRPRTNTFGAVSRVQNSLSMAVHEFFQKRGFLWIHTPIITGNDTEGAGNMFRVTTLDPHNPPRDEEGAVDYHRDFFGRQAYLTVSGQLQVENFACALSNVYTFGPTFRAENSHTSRHLSEFWMIEPEMAFCNLDENRALAEDCIKYLLSYLLEHCEADMAFFDRWVSPGIITDLNTVIEKSFVHMSYTDAVSELEKAENGFEFPVSWGMDLQAEHERYLTDAVVGGPVTVTDFPKDIKAFYMKQNDDNATVRAMDVLVPRLGEIIGGSQREEDAEKLSSRMEALGMDAEEYGWYLDLRRYGTVPHSGFGLGFERLVQYVTGMQNIRDVIPFPRTPGTIAF